MADLVTLERLKIALGIPEPAVEHQDDAKNNAALASASAIIRTFTDRSFEVSAQGSVATPRQFEYDGSGYLDIDDAQTITGVSAVYGGTTLPQSRILGTDEWLARPFNKPVKFWLQLPESYYAYGSPEMGFERNLDTYYQYGGVRGYGYPTIIEVTAVWGWPSIPEDIQQAVIWTALHLVTNPNSYVSESIESYSRSYSQGGGEIGDALPERARAVLLPYITPRV